MVSKTAKNNRHDKISVVIRNWAKPLQVQTWVLPNLENCDAVDEIIISHGKEKMAFKYQSDKCSIVHRKDYGVINDEYGLARSYLAATEARNDIVLINDDDVIIPPKTILKLIDEFKKDPEVIHSLLGRPLTPEFEYNYDRAIFGDVLIALGGVSMIAKKFAVLTLAKIEEFTPVINAIGAKSPQNVLWNGEEILSSFLAVNLNKRFNKAHELPMGMFKDDLKRSVSYRAGHITERTKIVRLLLKKWDLYDYVQTTPNKRVKKESTIRRRRAIISKIIRNLIPRSIITPLGYGIKEPYAHLHYDRVLLTHPKQTATANPARTDTPTNTKISVAINNIRGQSHLRDVILPQLETVDCVDEVLISHISEQVAFDYESDKLRVVHAHNYDTLYGLYSTAATARNEIVLTLNDRTILTEEVIQMLIARHLENPDVLNGIHGKLLTRDYNHTTNSIARPITGNVEILLSTCTVQTLSFIKALLAESKKVEASKSIGLQILSQSPYIFNSLFAIKQSGKYNISHQLNDASAVQIFADIELYLPPKGNYGTVQKYGEISIEPQFKYSAYIADLKFLLKHWDIKAKLATSQRPFDKLLRYYDAMNYWMFPPIFTYLLIRLKSLFGR